MEDQIKKTIQSCYKHVEEAYARLEALGATMPAEKNIENLRATIESAPIAGEFFTVEFDAGDGTPTPETQRVKEGNYAVRPEDPKYGDCTFLGWFEKPSWDPNNPTLEGLKSALDDGKMVEIGTEIPDIWNGNSNPLVVGEYRVIEGDDRQDYLAVGLTRKYVDPVAMAYSTNGNRQYPNTTMFNYLNTTYLDACSDSLKALLGEVKVDWSNGSAIQQVSGKVHLFSGVEMCGVPNAGEGDIWELWSKRTGLTSADNTANAGRIMTGRDGTAYSCWLRTLEIGTDKEWYLAKNGAMGGESHLGAITTQLGVLPQFWILASSPVPQELYDFKKALDNGTAPTQYPVGTEIDDKYDGKHNPLIVAQYLDSSNNSLYGGAEGVILVRKHVDPISKSYEVGNYDVTSLPSYLNNTYYSNCSVSLQELASPIDIQCSNMTSAFTLPAQKFFLMSATELYAPTRGNVADGMAWDYWKNQTGFSGPNAASASGRIVTDTNGVARSAWTRSYDPAGQISGINTNGGISSYNIGAQSLGVLPACFISKASELPDSIDISGVLDSSTLDDIQKVVDAGKAEDYFKTGDTLKVKYGSYTMPFEIVGFEDVEVEGGETVHAINLLAQYTSEVTSTYGADGSTKYSASALRTSCTTTYQNKLDTNFVSALGSTKVQTYSRDGSTDTVYDKLFAPSMAQLGVTNTTYTTAQQTGVEGPAFTEYEGATDAKRVKQAINATTTAQNYWVRSFNSSLAINFGLILTSGAPGLNTYNGAYRVVVACNLVGKQATANARAVQAEPITAEEYNSLNLTAEEYNNKQITAENHNTAAKTILKKGE